VQYDFIAAAAPALAPARLLHRVPNFLLSALLKCDERVIAESFCTRGKSDSRQALKCAALQQNRVTE
jgi:hypothetical protein